MLKNLQGANLSGAASNSGQSTSRVIGANLQGAVARYANFERAIMERVNLNNTDLRGANFFETNMTRVSLQGSKYDIDAFDKSINV